MRRMVIIFALVVGALTLAASGLVEVSARLVGEPEHREREGSDELDGDRDPERDAAMARDILVEVADA